jgi:RNA 3'-terminal phosphate cyclase (ATP)
MNDNVFEVDGSVMEGGGQIIRMSIAFAALLKKPINLTKIRAGRTKPGLQAQHLNGIQLAAELCGARVDGCKLQSTQVQFVPGSASKLSSFVADTKTAGATTLLAQVALPCALLGMNSATRLDLKGGTNAEFAPQVEYYSQVFLPTLKKFGVSTKCNVIRKGYFPKGGGQILLDVSPVKELQPIDLTDFGDVKSVNICASVAGILNVKLAQEMARGAKDVLVEFLGRQSNVRVSVDAFKENEAFGNGNSILIIAETSTGCVLGSGRIGSRGKSGAELGIEAAEELIGSLKIRACLDQYLQDQTIIYMALAGGVSRVRTGPLTLHTKTAIHIAEMLSGAIFKVEQSESEKDVHFIECRGISFKNES